MSNLQAFLQKHDHQKLTPAIVDSEVGRLSTIADGLPPEAAKLVRNEVRALQGWKARLLAGHKALDGWNRDADYQVGDCIFRDGVIYQCRSVGGGKREDWVDIVGTPPPAEPAKPTLKDWGLSKEFGPKPRYPVGIRVQGRQKELDDTYEELEDWWREKIARILQESGLHPHQKLSAMLFATFAGEAFAEHEWGRSRLAEAETRIAALEKLVEDLKRQPIVVSPNGENTGKAVRKKTTVLAHDESGRIKEFETVEMPIGDDLAERVDALEKKPSMAYRGVWSAAERYEPGATVSHGGSAWVAKIASTGVKPGEGLCWQLAVKRGRDGKDKP